MIAPRSLRFVLGALTALVVSALATSVSAQSVAPSAGQEQLNDQAVEAAIAGNFDKAVRLFRASLDLGELNVTYLNLGRALFKLGKCDEADQAYASALTAPQVASPTPDEVQEFVATYRAEFDQKCPGEVRLSCTPATMKVSVDEGLEKPCPTVLKLPPGEHNIAGVYGEKRVEQNVTISPMGEVSVTLEIEGVEEDDGEGISTSTWAWIATGVGGALVLTGLIVDAAVIGPDFEDYEDAAARNDVATYNDLKSSIESQQTLNLVVFVTGGVALATGGALFLMDAGVFGGGESASIDSGGRFGVWGDARTSGVSWTLEF